jgi:hypothetical protein
MTENTNIVSFGVVSSKISQLCNEVAKMNRKAAKYGLPLIKIIVGDSYTEKQLIKEYGYFKRICIEKTNVTIIGNIPNIPNFSIAAVIDHHPIAIVHSYMEIPEHFRNRGSYCDHCHSMRMRNKTIILKNKETGEFIQVGSTCLKDYLNLDISRELSHLTWVDDIKDEYENIVGGRMEYNFDLLDVFTATVKIINTFGFVKVSDNDYESGKVGTKYHLSDYFIPNSQDTVDYYKNKLTLNDEIATETAKHIIDWIKNNDSNNEFMVNLKAMISLESIPTKYFGYIAGAVASYIRENESKKVEKIEFNNTYRPEEIKSRITFKARLISIRAIDSFYGTSYMHKFMDDENREIIWFCSGNPLMNSDEIDSYKIITITGTIKEKKEYNNKKQTYLTRVKMM